MVFQDGRPILLIQYSKNGALSGKAIKNNMLLLVFVTRSSILQYVFFRWFCREGMLYSMFFAVLQKMWILLQVLLRFWIWSWILYSRANLGVCAYTGQTPRLARDFHISNTLKSVPGQSQFAIKLFRKGVVGERLRTNLCFSTAPVCNQAFS